MAADTRLSTSVLLTCAAIGVATGVLGGIAGWITIPVLAALPIVYGFVLGVHVLPGIIAQEALRLPWVALITHGVAALVGIAIAPIYAGQYIGTAILFGGSQISSHSGGSFPMILAGGNKLGFKHGQHVKWKGNERSASDFYLTVLQQLGCPVKSFKESTGPLTEILA